MLSKVLLAWILVAICVVTHAAGVTSAMRWVRRHPSSSQRFWVWMGLFIRLAGWIILLHLAEIAVWAALYAQQGAMPDLPSALYFSAVTYTTTGYGDLVLPPEWRAGNRTHLIAAPADDAARRANHGAHAPAVHVRRRLTPAIK